MRGATATATVEGCKAYLFGALRNEFVQRASGGRESDAESLEWTRLEQGHKMALLLLAGIDGDLAALSHRAWRELPEPERQAIKSEARAMKKSFGAVSALSGRW